MTRHLAAFALGLAAGALLAVLLTHPTASRQASAPRPARVDPGVFRLLPPPARTASPTPPATHSPMATVPVVTDQPSPTTRKRPASTRVPPAAHPPVAHIRLRGVATWFRAPAGTAAAGPALRHALGSHWRGQRVTVCAGRCVVVRLTDWCLCSRGDRVIDLAATAFARLAPLSRGVLVVTIR